MKPNALALFGRVLRNEGPLAVRDRILDRFEEARRQRALVPITSLDDSEFSGATRPRVLNVSPFPVSPKRGGSQIQMVDRLSEERRSRTVAIAYPRGSQWLLEIWSSEQSFVVDLDTHGSDTDIVATAAKTIGADAVHVENAHGFPPDLTRNLVQRGLQTILSIHDFSLFCRRPHLVDVTTGTFCDFSRDEDRCARCLRGLKTEGTQRQADYRIKGGEAVAFAHALVFPSEYLRLRFGELYPTRNSGQYETVVAPATKRALDPVSFVPSQGTIGFVGGAHQHKGGALIPQTIELVRQYSPSAKGIVYGYGDPELTSAIRSSRHLRIRGYYRAGEFAGILAKDRVGVAVFPSIWPEAYGIVVDECLATGIPVVAFDLGAVGDRLRSWGVGAAVLPDDGAAGLAKAASGLLDRGRCDTTGILNRIPRVDDTAHAHIEVYNRLGLEMKSSRAADSRSMRDDGRAHGEFR